MKVTVFDEKAPAPEETIYLEMFQAGFGVRVRCVDENGKPISNGDLFDFYIHQNKELWVYQHQWVNPEVKVERDEKGRFVGPASL